MSETPLIDYANLDEATRFQARARLARAWKPTPSGLKGGDKVLGYAACVFDEPGHTHHTHVHPAPGA